MSESQVAVAVDGSMWKLPKWWVLVLLGVGAIVTGVLAIVWSNVTLLVLGLIFGIFLLVWGVTTLIGVFEPGESFPAVVLGVVLGIVSTIAGLILILRPGASVMVLLFVIAIWFIVVGISGLVRGIVEPAYRWWNLLIGLLMLIAGIIIASDPDIGLETLALVVGISLIVRGILDIALGALVKSAQS